jgi:hypothetical protein
MIQEPSTWRSMRHGTPPTDDYLEAREQLKTGSENQEGAGE